MNGEWRCQLCDEAIEGIYDNPNHKNCPPDLTPGAYWCEDEEVDGLTIRRPRIPGKALGCLVLSILLGFNVANAQECQPEGAALECPGHGTKVRCEVPPDAQAVADRQILLRLYINGRFVDYPATDHFMLDDKVYAQWPVQVTDDIYWGTCTNHLLENPCTVDENDNVQPPGCAQDKTSEPMYKGYNYGQPLPEARYGLIFGIGLLYLINKRRKV